MRTYIQLFCIFGLTLVTSVNAFAQDDADRGEVPEGVVVCGAVEIESVEDLERFLAMECDRIAGPLIVSRHDGAGATGRAPGRAH